MEIRRLQWPKAEILYIFVFHAPATHQIYFFVNCAYVAMGGMRGNPLPPLKAPISYLVIYELLETLIYCVLPPMPHGHVWNCTLLIIDGS